jgi:hypothetical protein
VELELSELKDSVSHELVLVLPVLPELVLLDEGISDHLEVRSGPVRGHLTGYLERGMSPLHHNL